MIALLEGRGFIEGNNANPGTYVVEKAFVANRPAAALRPADPPPHPGAGGFFCGRRR
jgi:hypothetical protein